jgi:hypothetical protein
LVIDAAGRKAGKRKQTVSVECMKIVGFWLHNLSALAGAERKPPPAQLP